MAAATQVEVGVRRLFDKNEPKLLAQRGPAGGFCGLGSIDGKSALGAD